MKATIQNIVKESIKQAMADSCLQDVSASVLSDYDFDLWSIVADHCISNDDTEFDRLMIVAQSIATDTFNRIMINLKQANNLINAVLS